MSLWYILKIVIYGVVPFTLGVFLGLRLMRARTTFRIRIQKNGNSK
jgi:hypothetical protein